DLENPVSELFDSFSREPLGAASLAQAHLAILHGGKEVVVKILRPGVQSLVETDLAVIRLVSGWFKMFKHIRSRMDLDRLVEEFITTTRNELDLIKERENIRRFTEDFKDDPMVYIPGVYKESSTCRSLIMENVFYIKIADTETVEACGVSCARVADKLYDVYMKQIFLTNFVHVDPHPGNLFVKPLPFPDEIRKGVPGFAPGETPPFRKGRPFQIVFIDFGMIAVIPDRLKAAMRMAAIGVGTMDAYKIVQSYVIGGMLQPGADLRRLEQAHEDWLQRLWGVRMGKIQAMAYQEARYFLREYRDLIAETPFQIQADTLFVGRAVGILSGMATRLDPEFDPWAKTIPFAKRFATEELKADWKGWADEILILGQHILKLPTELNQTLIKARQGSLAIQVSLSPETRKAIKRIDLSVKRFSWMVLTAALLISGVNLHIDEKNPILSVLLITLAVITFLWGMRRS
ncbi:MAG: AarF/ABC1/UbiB kinase family protein, partial [Desulfobacterales bacterium]|nr:AarF/ABC1/UbiB kinase family protein [Desulfobacterales bacterium]